MMANKILCVTAVVTLFCNGAYGDPFFRKDYTYLEKADSFYRISRTRTTWWAAKKRCSLEWAQLWVPENLNEINAVMEFWNRTENIDTAFIGASDLISPGNFITIDGRTLEETYARWADGEPNNNGGGEHCVHITPNSFLYDVNCSRILSYVCKKTHASLDWNVLCDVPDLGYKYSGEMAKCYKLHKRPKIWNNAHATCSAEQSYLAIINSVKERDVLVKMISDAQNNKRTWSDATTRGLVHIGFQNRDGDGWATVKGTPLENSGYEHWAENQPEHYNTNRNYCGAINFAGELHETACDQLSYFICEHDVDRLSMSIDEKHGVSQP